MSAPSSTTTLTTWRQERLKLEEALTASDLKFIEHLRSASTKMLETMGSEVQSLVDCLVKWCDDRPTVSYSFPGYVDDILEARGHGMPIATMCSSHEKVVLHPALLFPDYFTYLPDEGSWGSCSTSDKNGFVKVEEEAYTTLVAVRDFLINEGFACDFLAFSIREKGYGSGYPREPDSYAEFGDDGCDDFCLFVNVK